MLYISLLKKKKLHFDIWLD